MKKKKRDTEQLIEVVKVTENFEEHYYRKPGNGRYQFYPTAKIPVGMFVEYLEARSQMMRLRNKIRRYFTPLKDEPMRVEKNHISEGELRENTPLQECNNV